MERTLDSLLEPKQVLDDADLHDISIPVHSSEKEMLQVQHQEWSAMVTSYSSAFDQLRARQEAQMKLWTAFRPFSTANRARRNAAGAGLGIGHPPGPSHEQAEAPRTAAGAGLTGQAALEEKAAAGAAGGAATRAKDLRAATRAAVVVAPPRLQ